MTADEQPLVLQFGAIDETQVALVGGKAANLAALSRLGDVPVPPGCCVTTRAFREAVLADPTIDRLVGQLAGLAADDREAVSERSGALRAAIEAVVIPDDLAAAITGALSALGAREAYAVRSSATTEDSATASFAGQHDSFLNVVGANAVLDHVRRCWASLFTEQAVTYRVRHGFDHRAAEMAVVVQQMVAADAAGVLFTADPIDGNRTVVSIEAVAGLGEALVAGTVSPDGYRVRSGAVVDRTIIGEHAVLTDAQVLDLAALGRRIEAAFARPQDIEWCLAGGELAVVQSRPITTLYPVPRADDDEPHVYVSVGHQQMMTDAMKPLGLSLFQLTAAPRMYEAGGRLFVDVAPRLAEPATRDAVIAALGTSDPLIGDALTTLADAGFVPLRDGAAAGLTPPGGPPPPTPIPTDSTLVHELIAATEASIATLQREIADVSGPAVFAFILGDIQVLKQTTFDPRSMHVIMAGMDAAAWLNDHLETWLGEKNVADTLAQSVPGNVTAEMGLELLDVADAVRPHPEVVAFLESGVDDAFLDELSALPGGAEARAAIETYLGRYGIRGVAEIDVTRPRWREHPAALVPAILANVRNFEAGAGPRRFEQGRREALAKEHDVLTRLRALPDDGDAKARETEAMIDRLRRFSGYREFPKYGIVGRYDVYKRALLREADRLVADGVLADREDCFFLRFEEFQAASGGDAVDPALIAARKATFRADQALTPPRVLTSDGAAVAGTYRRDDVPAGALIGLPVSSGTVEGRARVVLDLADATFEPGDILVTTFTDPSWTPVFVGIDGLVTEVGGLMTHGAVIAREYGLPAVVGVQHATTSIRDGQRIRVHGTDGFVKLLPG
jgi:pyruvate,water dikinase